MREQAFRECCFITLYTRISRHRQRIARIKLEVPSTSRTLGAGASPQQGAGTEDGRAPRPHGARRPVPLSTSVPIWTMPCLAWDRDPLLHLALPLRLPIRDLTSSERFLWAFCISVSSS